MWVRLDDPNLTTIFARIFAVKETDECFCRLIDPHRHGFQALQIAGPLREMQSSIGGVSLIFGLPRQNGSCRFP